jgi:Tfp pilus assembly protein PilF
MNSHRLGSRWQPASQLPWLSLVAIWIAGCAQVPADPSSLIDAGYASALRGDVVKAKESYEKAIALDPNRKGTRVSYGWALFNLGLPQDALKQWTAAFAGIDREAPNLEVCLALACHQLGRKQEALEWYVRQVSRDERFEEPALLEFATGHWTAKERAALQALFQEYRRRARTPAVPEPPAGNPGAPPRGSGR